MVGFIFIVTIISLLVFGYYQRRTSEITKELISKIDFECPVGSSEEINQWGISGYKRYCVEDEILNGLWTAWENKIVAVKGRYKMGKEEGTWTWYKKKVIFIK